MLCADCALVLEGVSRVMKIQSKLKAAALHFLISVVIAALVASAVFGLWFPYPLRVISGAQHLFWLVVAVDVVCGPLLTAVVFNPIKSRREICLDLGLVALVQLSALGYGVYSLSQARPVAVVFEDDRFVAVPAAHVDSAELSRAPMQFQVLSWTGPVLLGTRSAKGQSTEESLDMFLQGKATSSEPSWWRTYAESQADVQRDMKPLDALFRRSKIDKKALLEAAAASVGKPISSLYYVPLTGQNFDEDWCVLLDAKANIVGYVAVDGFE